MELRRKAAALGAATVLVGGSAALTFPGIAAADTKSTNCGGSVTAQVGDTVLANTSVLGLNLGSVNLGVVSEGTTVLSKTLGLLNNILCQVTVTVTQVVDDTTDAAKEATGGVPVVGGAVGAVSDGVQGTTEQTRKLAGATAPPSDGGGSGLPPNKPGDGTGGGAPPGPVNEVPGAASPADYSNLGGNLPFNYNFGSSPMSYFGAGDYGSLFNTAPGLQYGAGFDDYAPEFGLLGEDGNLSGNPIRNAGQAQTLPPVPDSGIGLPMLLAVLALAGASAGLVRTWVLRLATESSV